MSELSLVKWETKKVDKFSNAVGVGTMVFIYIKDDKTRSETNANNELFIKLQLGLGEDEEMFDNTQGYLDAIGKNNKELMSNKKITEIKKINLDITQFILENLHRIYWRDFANGVISSININKALEGIIPATIEFRKVLVMSVDKKYPKELSVASVKNIVETHDIETNQALGKNIKKINKK